MKNSRKIPEKFPKNSRKIPEKFPKNPCNSGKIRFLPTSSGFSSFMLCPAGPSSEMHIFMARKYRFYDTEMRVFLTRRYGSQAIRKVSREVQVPKPSGKVTRYRFSQLPQLHLELADTRHRHPLAKAADLANHRAFVQRIAAHGTAALPVPLPAVAEQPAQRRHAHFSVARLELADSPAPAFFSRSIPSSSFSRRSMYS